MLPWRKVSLLALRVGLLELSLVAAVLALLWVDLWDGSSVAVMTTVCLATVPTEYSLRWACFLGTGGGGSRTGDVECFGGGGEVNVGGALDLNLS